MCMRTSPESWCIALCTNILSCAHTLIHTDTQYTHIYSMHSFTHSVIHTYNIMRWLLSSQPVCLVWGRTKNNISLLSVVTGTVWVWRAGGVVSLWFIENSGRPTRRSSLTSPLTLEKLGRKQCVCVLHGSAQEPCAFQWVTYRLCCKSLDVLRSFVLDIINSIFASLLWAHNTE